jgi:hypothetical protein
MCDFGASLFGIDIGVVVRRIRVACSLVSRSATGSAIVMMVEPSSFGFASATEPGDLDDRWCIGRTLSNLDGGSLRWWNGNPRALEYARPPSSFAVVTTVMSKTADAIDAILVDLSEHGLSREAEGVAAAAVELLCPTGRGSRGTRGAQAKADGRGTPRPGHREALGDVGADHWPAEL